MAAPPATMPSSSAEEADAEASRVNIFLHAENTRIFSNDHLDRRLPVTLVTGHLGSGKTTLLKHILTNRSNLRIAAAINDFAELNIDEKLVKNVANGAERLVELSNGCVCCHLLDDLKEAVFKLLETGGAVDTDEVNYLLVETSGVTDPMSVIRTLDAKFGKTFRARLDAVVTVIDSDQFLHSPPSLEAIAQLRAADIVLMNKVDLLQSNGADLDLVEGRIRSYNPTAEVYRTVRSNIPLHKILDVSPADAESAGGDAVIPISHERTKVPLYVSSVGGALRREGSSSISGSNSSSHSQNKLSGYSSISITLDDRPLNLAKLEKFITSARVQKLARMKGVLWIHGMDSHRCVLHLSGRGRLGFEQDGKWSGPPKSELAFIGPNVDAELEKEFAKCCIEEDYVGGERSTRGEDGGIFQKFRESKEFEIVESSAKENNAGITFFCVSGSKYYNYTDEQIERELRIDTDAMNLDLADAINASVANDQGNKAFLAHTNITDIRGRNRIALCWTTGEPGNNIDLLTEQAREILATYFRNISDCRCGK